MLSNIEIICLKLLGTHPMMRVYEVAVGICNLLTIKIDIGNKSFLILLTPN